MEYRSARPEDVPGLKRLWERCFGDDPAFIDRFFAHLFRPEHMAVCAMDGMPVSMVAFLPCRLRGAGADLPCAYLYAMATDPARQGRGLGQALLRFAHSYGREQGWRGLTLVPADQGLFQFYAKAEFQTAFFYRQLRWSGSPTPGAGVVSPAVPEAYRRLREQLLAQIPHLDHTLPFLAHAEQEYRRTGGGLFRIELPGGFAACAAVERSAEGVWQAKELLAPEGRQEAALAALARRLGTGTLTTRTTASGARQAVPFGMARWSEPIPQGRSAYLGLALD